MVDQEIRNDVKSLNYSVKVQTRELQTTIDKVKKDDVLAMVKINKVYKKLLNDSDNKIAYIEDHLDILTTKVDR